MAPGYPDEWRVRLHNETVKIRQARERQEELIAQALAAGGTWTEIARALGVTRQSAHRAYRHLHPTVQAPEHGVASAGSSTS